MLVRIRGKVSLLPSGRAHAQICKNFLPAYGLRTKIFIPLLGLVFSTSRIAPQPRTIMYIIEIFAIAVALSMDALAVSVTTGVTLKQPNARQLFRMPAAFGIFQALMPITGWFLGKSVLDLIAQWDHWVACGLLVLVGAKLLHETLSGEGDDAKPVDPTRGWTIVVLAIATSIDALAVGFSFAILSKPILFPSVVIGLTCAAISLAGMLAGSCIGRIEAVRKWSGVAGSCALFAIGILILHDHGVF